MKASKGLLPNYLAAIILLHNLTPVVPGSGGVMGGFPSSSSSGFSSSSGGGGGYYAVGGYYDGAGGGGGGNDNRTLTRSEERQITAFLICIAVSIGLAILFFLVCCFYGTIRQLRQAIRPKSVAMLQIALSGTARSIQKELNKSARTTNTCSTDGINSMLHETASTLLKHQGDWTSGYSQVARVWTVRGMEDLFDKLSNKEREKFDVETLVNTGNVIVLREFVRREERISSKQLLVVTTLVGSKRYCSLPSINDRENLEIALEKLSSYRIRDGEGVQVLWTPQNENDALLPKELCLNYPLLPI